MVKDVVGGNGVTWTQQIADGAGGRPHDAIGRPYSIAITGASSSWSLGPYAYDGAGNIKQIGSTAPYESYVYDKVLRMTSGTIVTGGVNRTQTAAYTAFGFMTNLTTNGSGQSFTEVAGTNRISGSTYNAAGSMTSWGGYSYTWDPLNQMASVSGGTMTKRTLLYTADGERIEERVGSDPLNPTSITLSARGLDGKVLRLLTKSGGSWSWTKDYVYRDGVHLASLESSGTRYFHLDHLGTIRRITDTATPPAIVAAHDYYPFGSEATSPSQDGERMKWAGSERDQQGTPTVQTDDLDYLHARYQAFNLGRFLSLDPVRGDRTRPQSFNLFAYVSNNPINRTDPLGLLEATTTPQASGGLTTMVGDGLCASQDDASDPDCEAYQRKVREEEEAKRAKLLVLEAVNAGARSPEETVALAHRLAGQGLRVCLGCARVLQGNSRTIGRQGAFPGRTVSAGSAAVIPSQWGGKAKLRPILDLVGGTAGGSAFRGISDVVGGDSPIPGWGVREALQLLFPGQLILELPSAPTDQGSMVDVLLVGLPRGVPCPAGTSECT